MIILGDKHKFSSNEKEVLKRTFDAIDSISYRNADTEAIISQIASHLDRNASSLILLNTQARIPDALLSYLVQLESRNISYLTIESFMEKYLHKCYIPEDQSNASFLESIKPYSSIHYLQKRTIDYLSSFVLGAVFLLLLPLILYRSRKESPGSLFFKQTRIGLNGKPFTCYKFRSMHENSHHDPYTQEGDSRIFPWGETMRKYRIDELPQIWNVLRGDMHLLGPRAEWDILVKNYEKEIPYYQHRHIVRPGITGWAQVNYPYGANTEDARQKLMYDLYYIKYWSLWLEIQTIWKTIGVMLGKKGR